MKYNNTNITLKALALLFTLQIYMLYPIQLPWYQQLCNKGGELKYKDNCSMINAIQTMRYYALIAYHRIINKKSVDKVVISIQNELADIEQWMLELEHEALLAIKKKYAINDIIWQKYMADMHRMKTIYTKNLKKNNPDIVHDPDVPAHVLEMLFSLLQQNGINPHSINIKMITDQHIINENPHIIAQAKSSLFFMNSDASEQNFLSYTYEHPSIEIFPQMLAQTSNNRLSTCAHEIQHIIQHHTLMLSILYIYLNHYYHVTREALEQTPEYHQLAQIYEAQAEILAAIKNPKIAECLKTKRQQFFYPDHLYEDHFFHLAYINTLWKTREWLEKLS